MRASAEDGDRRSGRPFHLGLHFRIRSFPDFWFGCLLCANKGMAWTRIAARSELPSDALIEVEINGRYIAVCNVGGEIRALDGTCPHQGGPLGEGALNGEFVTCPWHMWDFHSETGACSFNDRVRVAVYPVRLEGEAVLADLVVPEPQHA